jgi:hypothetical protein
VALQPSLLLEAIAEIVPGVTTWPQAEALLNTYGLSPSATYDNNAILGYYVMISYPPHTFTSPYTQKVTVWFLSDGSKISGFTIGIGANYDANADMPEVKFGNIKAVFSRLGVPSHLRTSVSFNSTGPGSNMEVYWQDSGWFGQYGTGVDLKQNNGGILPLCYLGSTVDSGRLSRVAPGTSVEVMYEMLGEGVPGARTPFTSTMFLNTPDLAALRQQILNDQCLKTQDTLWFDWQGYKSPTPWATHTPTATLTPTHTNTPVPTATFMPTPNENGDTHGAKQVRIEEVAAEMFLNWVYSTDKKIIDLAWSTDGRYFAFVTAQGTVTAIDRMENTIVFQFALNSSTQIAYASLAWSPDGEMLAAGLWNQIYVWDVSTWQLQYQSVVGDADGFTQLDLELGEIPEGIAKITWSMDSQHLISGSISRITTVWNRQNLQILYQTYDSSGGGLGRIWLSSNDGWLGDGATKLNIFTQEKMRPSQSGFPYRLQGGYVNATDQRPNSDQIVWATELGFVIVQNMQTLGSLFRIELTARVDPNKPRALTDAAWDGSGNFIVVVSRDGEMYVVNAQTQQFASVMKIDGTLYTVDWNPRTNEIIYGGVSNTGQPILATVDVGGIAGVPVSTVTPTIPPPKS